MAEVSPTQRQQEEEEEEEEEGEIAAASSPLVAQELLGGRLLPLVALAPRPVMKWQESLVGWGPLAVGPTTRRQSTSHQGRPRAES